MYNFAYFDGFKTTTTADDNMCNSSSSPCTDFTTAGAYPTYKYYGYFSPDHWYTYGSSKFTPTDPKTGSGLSGARAKAANEWDGNFLNWLIMRRVDVVRKIMTGGKGTPATNPTSLQAERADGYGGQYKRITIDGYVDNSLGTGSRCITVPQGAAGTSQFSVRNGAGCSDAVAGGPYSVDIVVLSSALPVEGVLQRAVGAKARIGLTFYKSDNEGGYVQTSVTGTSLSAVINQIRNTPPATYTPLGESLWTVTGYFAQQASIAGGPGPRYASGDFQINNTNDPLNYGTGGSPVYRSCGKSFVLLLTDGEPYSDGNLPNGATSILNYAQGKSSFNCGAPNASDYCPATAGIAPETYSFPAQTSNTSGVEDVALYMHTTDLRNSPTLGSNNISGTQNLMLYVVSAFGRDLQY